MDVSFQLLINTSAGPLKLTPLRESPNWVLIAILVWVPIIGKKNILSSRPNKCLDRGVEMKIVVFNFQKIF